VEFPKKKRKCDLPAITIILEDKTYGSSSIFSR
jgi:hypothetical protein